LRSCGDRLASQPRSQAPKDPHRLINTPPARWGLSLATSGDFSMATDRTAVSRCPSRADARRPAARRPAVHGSAEAPPDPSPDGPDLVPVPGMRTTLRHTPSAPPWGRIKLRGCTTDALARFHTSERPRVTRADHRRTA